MSKKGFTLIELLGAILLISIISVYTLPKVQILNQQMNIKEFTSEIKEEVHIAQLKSREEKTYYGIQFTDKGYYLIELGNNKKSSLNKYPTHISFSRSDFEENLLIFMVDGSPKTTGDISFYYDERELILTIKPATGGVISKWD